MIPITTSSSIKVNAKNRRRGRLDGLVARLAWPIKLTAGDLVKTGSGGGVGVRELAGGGVEGQAGGQREIRPETFVAARTL